MVTSDADVVAVAPETETASTGDQAASSARRASPWLLVVLIVACSIPFVVVLIALAEPTWYPTLDIAHTSLRVRDVFSSDPPLIGLPGRIGSAGQQGSHPGPLSFWALAPLAKLWGGSTWALEAATASLNVIASVLALWMARRRGGTGVLLGVAAALATLLAFYGPDILTAPWNPYLPVMWWFVFLIAVWSVWCEDFAALPILVFAGSFCMQTHISYAGLGGGLSGLTALWLGWCLWKRWSDRPARRSLLGWIAVGAGLGVILWLPPVIQQLTGEHGNLSIIYGHFTNPPEEAVGLRTGLRVILVHLNPWRLVTGADAMQGATLPGALFALVWIGAAVVAWRSKVQALIRLDLVTGVALLLALISASRIFGFLWFYLVLWSWSVTVLMLLGIGWAIAVGIARREPADRRHSLATVGVVVVSVVVVAALASFTVEASKADSLDLGRSEMLSRIVPPSAAKLASGDVPGGGKDGKYLVTWTDPYSIGAAGFGLVDALDRRGFHVGVEPKFTSAMTRGRAFPRTDATGEIHLAIGKKAIEEWRAKPDAVLLASERPTAARPGRVRAVAEVGDRAAACGRPRCRGPDRGRQPLHGGAPERPAPTGEARPRDDAQRRPARRDLRRADPLSQRRRPRFLKRSRGFSRRYQLTVADAIVSASTPSRSEKNGTLT